MMHPSSTTRYRHYIMFVCLAVTVMSYIDRQIISILMEPIRHELHLNDRQLGLLAGILFSFFFIVTGVPLARLSDTGTRRTIIATCIGAWSIATTMCGFAQNFVQLAIARTTVAIGEAGSAPGIFSLLADIYSPKVRARVYALIGIGSAIGISFGLFIGGALSEHLGWRMTFIAVGVPGILVALLMRFTVAEPPRSSAGHQAPQSLLESVKGLCRLRSFPALLIISSLGGTTGYAMMTWMPSFLIRVHGVAPTQVGFMIGLALIIGISTGNGLVGIFADNLGSKRTGWLLWLSGIGMIVSIPLGLIALRLESPIAVVVVFTVFMHFIAYHPPLMVTSMVGVANARSRAVAVAIIPIAQAIGGGLGPFIVGAVSDATAASHGVDSVGIGMQVALAGAGLGAIGCLVATRWFEEEYRVE